MQDILTPDSLTKSYNPGYFSFEPFNPIIFNNELPYEVFNNYISALNIRFKSPGLKLLGVEKSEVEIPLQLTPICCSEYIF